MTKEKSPDAKLSFEDALTKLETIVRNIESGKVSLEESIEKYAEGIELIKQCRSILDSAEKKIQLLSKTDGQELKVTGQLSEQDESAE